MNTPIDLIRKTASIEAGRRHFEESPVGPSSLATVSLSKVASADQRLLRVAAWASGDDDALELYELLGGTYKGIRG